MNSRSGPSASGSANWPRALIIFRPFDLIFFDPKKAVKRADVFAVGGRPKKKILESLGLGAKRKKKKKKLVFWPKKKKTGP